MGSLWPTVCQNIEFWLQVFILFIYGSKVVSRINNFSVSEQRNNLKEKSLQVEKCHYFKNVLFCAADSFKCVHLLHKDYFLASSKVVQGGTFKSLHSKHYVKKIF